MTLTHCLFPGPISRHEIFKAMSAIRAVFLIRRKIKVILEFWVAYHFMNKESWITEPDIIVGCGPWWFLTIRSKGFRLRSIVVESKALPGNIS